MIPLAWVTFDRSQSNGLDDALAHGVRSRLTTLYSRLHVVGKEHTPEES